jgi:hypothetical protein
LPFGAAFALVHFASNRGAIWPDESSWAAVFAFYFALFLAAVDIDQIFRNSVLFKDSVVAFGKFLHLSFLIIFFLERNTRKRSFLSCGALCLDSVGEKFFTDASDQDVFPVVSRWHETGKRRFTSKTAEVIMTVDLD